MYTVYTLCSHLPKLFQYQLSNIGYLTMKVFHSLLSSISSLRKGGSGRDILCYSGCQLLGRSFWNLIIYIEAHLERKLTY